MFVHYVDGEYVNSEDAKISIFDRCVLMGDAVFDTTRTFRGKPFKVEEHLRRLEDSLRFVEIDPAAVIPQVRSAVAEVVHRNQAALGAVGDAWIMIIVSRGAMAEIGIAAVGDPTVLVCVKRFDLGGYADLYERGVDVGMSLMTRHFAGALDARVKSTNRLAMSRPELKSRRMAETIEDGRGRGWDLVLTEQGSIAEATGANIVALEGNRIVHPPRHVALRGVSLTTLCELATSRGMAVEERELWLYDLITADAAYLTASSFCMLPIRAVDDIELRRRDDFFWEITSAWSDLVDLDYVSQAKEFAREQASDLVAARSS